MTLTNDEVLRVQLEATLAQFERQMKKAVSTGVVTATQIERRFEVMGSRVGGNARKAAQGLQGVMNVSSQGRFVLQNTAAQIGDIAVQLESGTAATRVFGQQLPQLLGGFGALGGALGLVAPLLGTVAAVGLPVAGMLLAVGDGADDTAEKVQTFAEKLTAARSALEGASEAARLAGSGGLEDLRKRYGEVTVAVTELADALAAVEKRAAKVKIGTLIEDLDPAQITKQLSEASNGEGIAAAKVSLNVPKEEVERVRATIKEFETALQSRPNDENLLSGLQASRELLALYTGDLKNAGKLAGDIKFDEEGIFRVLQLVKELPEALKNDEFARAADIASELREKMEALGLDVESGYGAQVVEIESVLREHVNQLDIAAGAASGVASAASGIAAPINSANQAAIALTGNLQAAMAALAAVTAGIANAQRRAQAQLRVRQQTIGDPAARAAGLAREDFQEKSGVAAFAAIRSGNTSALGQIADATDRISEEAANIKAAEEALKVAEKAFADSQKPEKTKKGGAKGGKTKKKTPLFEGSEREIIQIERRIEALGKTGAEVAALEAKYKLLDEAKRRNLDLDKESTSTGETLRQEIERQAQEIGNLTSQYDQARERAAYFNDIQKTVQDGFIDAIVEGKNFGGVLEDLAKQLAKAALQAALFNSGPFASGGGGGLLGGLFGGGGGGGILGGLFGGFREDGGPVQAGKAYVVGEKQPELFVPRTNGTIIPQVPTGRMSAPQMSASSLTLSDEGVIMATVKAEVRAAMSKTMNETLSATPGYLDKYDMQFR